MTIFQPTDIPSDIDTLEELVCWSNFTLARMYPDASIVTSTSPDNGAPVNELAAQVGMFSVSTTPVHWVFLGRIALDLDTAWLEGGKPWHYVQNLGDEVIPENLRLADENAYNSGSGGGSLNPLGNREITRAFSTRPVNPRYRGAFIRLRRVSDNAFRKFANNSGSDWYAYDDPENGLAAWLDGSIGTVNTWYDQSGREEHAYTLHEKQEPQIRLEEGMNYPYLWFDGNDHYFIFAEEIKSRVISGVVAEQPNAEDRDRAILGHRNERHFRRGLDKQWFYVSSSNIVLENSTLTVNNSVVDLEEAKPDIDWQIFTLETSETGFISRIGRDGTYGTFWHGKIAEILISREPQNFDASAAYQNIFDNFFGEIPDPAPDTPDDTNTDTGTETGNNSGTDTGTDTGDESGSGTDTDTDTNLSPVNPYVLEDVEEVVVVFSVRQLYSDIDHPLIQVQRGGDNLHRHFGETGGSNSGDIWYAYDDPENGLAAWLGDNPGYMIRWWSQINHGRYVTNGGRVIPNALGKYPAVWFNGTGTRLSMGGTIKTMPFWRSAHIVLKEDDFVGSLEGHYISGLPRGDNGEWVSTSDTMNGVRSGIFKVNGVAADPSAVPVSRDWSIGQFISQSRYGSGAIGALRAWKPTGSSEGGENIYKSETSNFWRGEIAEVVLIDTVQVDIDVLYADAASAFRLT